MLENLKQSIEQLNRAIANFEEAESQLKGIEKNEYYVLMSDDSEYRVDKAMLLKIRNLTLGTLERAIEMVVSCKEDLV